MSINISYMDIIGIKYPNVSARSGGDRYSDLELVVGDQIPSQAILDADILAETKARMWENIQAERYYQTHSLGVQVGTDRFHTDDTSRLQQIALAAYGSSMPPNIMWKTMAGTFVAMTPQLANQIMNAVAGLDSTIFTYAEVKKAELYASSDPGNYDVKSGWPTAFTPLSQSTAASIGSTSLTFPAPLVSSLPTTPLDGASLFVRQRAGRNMPGTIGANGLDYTFQPFLATQKVSWWTAQGNGTVVSVMNFGNTVTGTATTRTVTTANMLTSLRRLGYVTATTAGASAGTRHNLLQFWRGNAPSLGGFTYVARFGISAVNADMRWFVGQVGSASVIANVNPSTVLNTIGFGMDSGDTNVQFITNDGTGSATKTDMGATFPAAVVGQVYEVRIFCAPNGTFIGGSIENLNTGVVSTQMNITTNIPSSTTLMSPQIWVNSGTTASAVAIDVISQYTESDI